MSFIMQDCPIWNADDGLQLDETGGKGCVIPHRERILRLSSYLPAGFPVANLWLPQDAVEAL